MTSVDKLKAILKHVKSVPVLLTPSYHLEIKLAINASVIHTGRVFHFSFKCDATVCMLSFNPIKVNNYASLFNCTPVDRASDSMMAPT